MAIYRLLGWIGSCVVPLVVFLATVLDSEGDSQHAVGIIADGGRRMILDNECSHALELTREGFDAVCCENLTAKGLHEVKRVVFDHREIAGSSS